MEDPKNSIPIDEYLLGHLDPEAAQKVETEISANPDLQEQLDMEKEFVKGFTLVGQEQLRKRLDNIEKELDMESDKASHSKNSIAYYLAVAASIAAIVLFAYLLLSRGPDTEKVFANFYEPYPVSFSTRAGDTDEQLLEIGKLYENQQYEAAIPKLAALLKERPEDGQLHLALGISYLEIDDLEAAQNVFQNIRAEGIQLYNDLAVWYLALALIKADELDKARMWLQVLADNPEADRRVEAQELLLELR
jgi:cytochrome c-type biogenesis protein CcmH/NrfG